MRRPVCVIGLAFVVIIWIYLIWNPLPAAAVGEADKSTVILTGQVDKKEYRISNEQEILVIYLKKVQVLNPQTENPEQPSVQTVSDLSGIQGVICYLEKTEEKAGMEKGEEEAKLGSYVRVQGKLRTFAEATNPGEFDARSYYQILNLQARVQNARILAETESYDKFREGLWRIRTYLSSLLDACFEPKDASVMKAMLLGEKSGLDEDIKKLYQLNGIIHILSISGLHISLIGMGLYKILHIIRCPKLMNVLLSILFMYSYGIMTGMGISALRAIVMFSFHITAGLFKRTYDMLTAMTIVAVSILIGQPLYLHHSGFLFSFGAILGIGLFLPVLEENMLGILGKGYGYRMEKVMLTTLAVSIVTLPVYLCFYYEYPLYSLFLNLLVIPGAGFIVSDGLFSLVAAACYLPFGKYTALPAHLLFVFYEYCASFALRLPGSRNILGKPDDWQIVVFIALLCIALLYSKKWSRMLFWQWILLALLCITIRFQSGLQITLLDVGQGDGIYLADDMGGHYLIDGGSSSKNDVGTYQILPFLKEEGVDVLDAVFVTHMDSDHYNGIHMLLEEMDSNGIAINYLILPDIAEESKSGVYRELVQLAAEQGISVQYIHKGETVRHGKLNLTCLHPEAGTNAETNAASVVLYLEYEAFTALFTGDLEGSGEEEVRKQLEDYLTDEKGITVLKVAHHGSKNSTGEAFLETVSPYIALISAGKDNRYGHPHEELIGRLEQTGCYIYQTKERGAITVQVTKGGRSVHVKAYLEE